MNSTISELITTDDLDTLKKNLILPHEDQVKILYKSIDYNAKSIAAHLFKECNLDNSIIVDAIYYAYNNNKKELTRLLIENIPEKDIKDISHGLGGQHLIFFKKTVLSLENENNHKQTNSNSNNIILTL